MEWNPIRAWTKAGEISDGLNRGNAGTPGAQNSTGFKGRSLPAKIAIGSACFVIGLLALILIIGMIVGPADKAQKQPVPETSPTPKPEPVKLMLPPGEAQKQAIAFASEIGSTMIVCQVQGAAVAAALSRKEAVTAFEAAGHAVEYCGATGIRYGELKEPEGLPDQLEGQLRVAKNFCRESANAQADTFKQMRVALDSNQRVSDMAELHQISQKASESHNQCVESIEVAVRGAGGNAKDVKDSLGFLK